MSGISIKNFTRRHSNVWADLPFAAVAKEILPDWDISLVFAGATRARALNKKLRGKTYVPNVLSYVANKNSAEIIICPSEAGKQAPDFLLPASSFLLLLFIHGALHIKGWAHGARMERCERDLLAKFLSAPTDALHAGAHETTHRHRHRHRDVPGKNGRRRGAFR